MEKKYLDILLKQNVLTQKEYNEIFEKMRLTEDNYLVGVIPNEKTLLKYNLEGDLINGDLKTFVIKNIIVPYDLVNMPPFSKYGMMYCGICDRWIWFTKDNISERGLKLGYKPIEEATEEELWKMIGLSSRYWEINYKRWYYEIKDQNNKNK